MIRKIIFIFLSLLLPGASVQAQIPWDILTLEPEEICANPGFTQSWQPLNYSRYMRLGYVNTKLPNGKRASIKKVLDFDNMKVLDLVVPMDSFPEGHLDKLAMKTVYNGEILNHSNDKTLIRFSKRVNYRNEGEYVCQYSNRTGRWSELIKLGDVSELKFFHGIGSDKTDDYFYYGFGTKEEGRDALNGPEKFEIARLNLKTLQTEKVLDLNLPDRELLLHFDHTLISPDGRWLALGEYGDKAWRQNHPNDAEPVVYIVDIKNKTYKTHWIPDTPYGHFFTPDSKYLIVGGYETGQIVRIDLNNNKQTHAITSTKTIFGFHMSPSGNYFLVEYDEEKCPRKVIDVRSAHDLKLIRTFLLDELFPTKELSRSFKSMLYGRDLMSYTSSKVEGLEATRILIHRLPANMDPVEPGSSMEKKLIRAEAIANGKLYAQRTEMDLADRNKGDATAVTIGKDGNVIVTGKRYAGDRSSQSIIAKLTPSGKTIWETKAKIMNGGEDTEGVHVPMHDGGCVVYFMSYPHEKSYGHGRLVRVNGTGKIIYDYTFIAAPNPNARYVDQMSVNKDGSVALKGKMYLSKDEIVNWNGSMSASGKLTVNK